MNHPVAHFRFYEELNDFLKASQQKKSFRVSFNGRPTLRAVIHTLGVPHPEIELILVNGKLVTVDDDGVDIANLRLSGIFGKDGRIPRDGEDLCFDVRACGDQ